MSWQEYFELVKADQRHTCEGRLAVLEEARRLFRAHTHFNQIEERLRKGIAGFLRKGEVDWGWFGSMAGHGYFKQAVIQNEPLLSEALDQIPLNGAVTRDNFKRFTELFLSAFENAGIATGTRLLTMKRPDYFVCLDSKNKKELCRSFEISQIRHLEQYWELVVQPIIGSTWWKSPEPSDELGKRVWECRSAFLDVLFYRASEDEPEVTIDVRSMNPGARGGTELAEGTIVLHPERADWGPGKLVKLTSRTAHVLFRDHPGQRAKRLNLGKVALERASTQADEVLDNLPPLTKRNGMWWLPEEELTVEQAIEDFHARFPLGFEDPAYIGDGKVGERQYKVVAHELFEETLGNNQFQELLNGDIDGLRERLLRCVQKVNLLGRFDRAAFREALKAPTAEVFFRVLLNLLDAEQVTRAVFDRYVKALSELPAERTRVTSWPIATILPFLAQPDRHFFIKPVVTKNAAKRLGVELNYKSTLNWLTYESVLRMARSYREQIAALKPRDMIDVQSFIYVTCGGYEQIGL